MKKVLLLGFAILMISLSLLMFASADEANGLALDACAREGYYVSDFPYPVYPHEPMDLSVDPYVPEYSQYHPDISEPTEFNYLEKLIVIVGLSIGVFVICSIISAIKRR